MTDHEQWDELAAGYALHGLSAEDEATFVDHLESCSDCVATLKEHELVAAQLGSISHYRDDDEAPSWESMREAILGPRTEAPEVVDLAARRRQYTISRRVLAAAAAIVIVAGGGIATWRLTTGGGSSPSCSAASGCHQIQLDAGGRTLASLVVRNDTVTVTPTNMPAAPAGKIYVLWQQPRGGAATPISEFTAVGRSSPVSLRDPYNQTVAFAVSLETATGHWPARPTDMLASGVTT